MREFKKYSKIYRIGHKEVEGVLDGRVLMFEKIDGGNFRFYFSENGDIIFGSRSQQLTSTDGDDSNVAKSFKKVMDYVRDTILENTNVEYRKDCSHLIFYGEACFKHTINYDWERMPLFLGFDIYDTQEDRYLNYFASKHIFEEDLDLYTVPYLGVYKGEEINDDLIPVSKYALESSEDKKAEGVVFKNYDKQIFAKYVSDDFKEKNSGAFGGNPKYNKVDDTNNAEFVFKYCTNSRIEKIIMRYLNNGEDLDMKLMGKLIKETYEDIIEEEWYEILTSNWKLDFKSIRKLIAPRCRSVLEQMITNNAR